VLYRAEDDTGQGIGGHTSRLGLWTSIDGARPTERSSLPVLYLTMILLSHSSGMVAVKIRVLSRPRMGPTCLLM
jgi:hypothetical protein